MKERPIARRQAAAKIGVSFQDAQSLAGRWLDSPVCGNPDRRRAHTLALDRCRHRQGPQGEGRAEARPEAKGRRKR